MKQRARRVEHVHAREWMNSGLVRPISRLAMRTEQVANLGFRCIARGRRCIHIRKHNLCRAHSRSALEHAHIARLSGGILAEDDGHSWVEIDLLSCGQSVDALCRFQTHQRDTFTGCRAGQAPRKRRHNRCGARKQFLFYQQQFVKMLYPRIGEFLASSYDFGNKRPRPVVLLIRPFDKEGLCTGSATPGF